MPSLPTGITAEFGTTYTILSIDLGIARTNAEVELPGDIISVITINGELDVRLNEKDEPLIELDKTTRVITKPAKFQKLFFTNTAQAGKSALIYIGREASFEAYGLRVGAIGILDSLEARINPAKEDGNLASIQTRLDIALSALRDALLAEEHLYSQTINADETVAQSISLDGKGHKLLDVYASASAATTFKLEASNDNTNWIKVYESSVTELTYKDTLWNAYRYVKLSSAAAGAAGDTVTLILATK